MAILRYCAALAAICSAATVKASPGFKYQLVPPADDGVTVPEFSLFAEATTGQGTFQQLIDHKNPSLGTFSQRFWYNSDNWNGPGSPIIFFTPGEIAADNYGAYLTNVTITGLMAEAVKGAVVM